MVIEIVASPIHEDSEIINAENVEAISESQKCMPISNKCISKTFSIVAAVLIIAVIIALIVVVLIAIFSFFLLI
jgi:lipopolysaccharide/colanic/teichoic acid biosynthesis glycosyltransferase